jgi:hypothetical protein
MSLNSPETNFADKTIHDPNGQCKKEPILDCYGNGDGKMTCKWIDDRGHEHAFSYNSDTEYLWFNPTNWQWVALLKQTKDTFSPVTKKGLKAEASRNINDFAQTLRIQDCEGWHNYLGCPRIVNENNEKYYIYQYNGSTLKMNVKKQKIVFSEPDNKFMVRLIDIGNP